MKEKITITRENLAGATVDVLNSEECKKLTKEHPIMFTVFLIFSSMLASKLFGEEE